nr:MAG TPA: hypothetical protein [Caudoviricetes sp.]
MSCISLVAISLVRTTLKLNGLLVSSPSNRSILGLIIL